LAFLIARTGEFLYDFCVLAVGGKLQVAELQVDSIAVEVKRGSGLSFCQNEVVLDLAPQHIQDAMKNLMEGPVRIVCRVALISGFFEVFFFVFHHLPQ